MIQLLQALGSGETSMVEAPVPQPPSAGLLVEGLCSAVSPGTERMLVEFGRAGWIGKARRQPDKVSQVLTRVRTDGLTSTLEAVRSKLDTPIPLGYCHAGIVAAVGSAGLPFRPGDRVVSNGPHAEYVAVPWTLAARIPEAVSFEAAAFTPLGAIGLQGIRLAAPAIGETVVVYGLGLIGLLTVQMLRANGCRVLGIDTNAERLALARRFGVEPLLADEDVARRVIDATGGVGADAVLLTLASQDDAPIHHAATMSRKRGRIVLLGVTGLTLQRDDFYKKELSFSVSCSYGPGRYDPEYEEAGRDYPLPFVRWTAQRNFEAVLDLMAAGRLDPLPLVTHRFPFAEAERAYGLLASGEPSLGVLLDYRPRGAASVPGAFDRVIQVSPPAGPRPFSLGVIGAGNFSARVLLPALAAADARLRTIASRGGTSAAVAARRFGFERATSDVEAIFGDEAVDTVVVLTRHDSHASLVIRALEAGKHVFVEKPLAVHEPDLDRIASALAASGRLLTVGFNRRFAPLATSLRAQLQGRSGPAALVVTVNAGEIPADHWTQHPTLGGGRLIGEAVHFLDLARFLVGAPIAGVSAIAAQSGGRVHEDVAHLMVRFADGSTAAIHYLANGSAAFPKERIEVFAGGRIWRIDNWRLLTAFGGGRGQGGRFAAVRKGHREEVAAFAAAVRAGGQPPIPYEELFDVSRWIVRAAAQARAGAPQT